MALEIAADIVDFKDREAISEATDVGVSLGAIGYKRVSNLQRNHQSTGAYHSHLTKFMEKCIKANQMIGPLHHPVNIPFNVMPFGAAVARLPPEAYEDWIQGIPHIPKIRPTPDPSAPHDGDPTPIEELQHLIHDNDIPTCNSRQLGSSPNAHVYTDPELERNWVSFMTVIQCLVVLTACCSNIRGAKKDLSSAYRQLRARIIER